MNKLEIDQALRELGCSDHEIEFALISRDAILPVIEKQNLTEEQWEAFLHYCIPNEADWIACNKLYTDKDFKLKQSRLPRAYRMLVLMKPRQLWEALLKACGKWSE